MVAAPYGRLLPYTNSRNTVQMVSRMDGHSLVQIAVALHDLLQASTDDHKLVQMAAGLCR